MGFGGWDRIRIKADNGELVDAIAPVIVSASRSTDIPAFYGDWFVERVARGYASWVNPFSGQVTHVSFAQTRAVAFWTKNPRPFLTRLRDLDRLIPNYYFLYTLNDYGPENWEPHVPPLDDRVDTFLTLSERLGAGRMVWRFDPLILSDTTDIPQLSRRVENVAARLEGATGTLVISFVDIQRYPKVKRNLARAGARCREFTDDARREVAGLLAGIGERHGMQVATCAEEIDLQAQGVAHHRCIDDALLRREFGDDRALMAFVGEPPVAQGELLGSDTPRRHPLKDRGQRSACGCIVSKDIGRYDTCPHLCVYCYANSSPEAVQRNRALMDTNYGPVLGVRPNTCSRCGMCG